MKAVRIRRITMRCPYILGSVVTILAVALGANAAGAGVLLGQKVPAALPRDGGRASGRRRLQTKKLPHQFGRDGSRRVGACAPAR